MFLFRPIASKLGALLLALPCSLLGAQERDPLDVPPEHNSPELQQLLELDDTQFNKALQENNGARFRSVVSAYDPPGTSAFPVSHGFAGAKQTCLVTRAAVPCRLYVSDLLAVQRERQNAGAASNNPFTAR